MCLSGARLFFSSSLCSLSLLLRVLVFSVCVCSFFACFLVYACCLCWNDVGDDDDWRWLVMIQVFFSVAFSFRILLFFAITKCDRNLISCQRIGFSWILLFLSLALSRFEIRKCCKLGYFFARLLYSFFQCGLRFSFDILEQIKISFGCSCYVYI